MKRKLCVFALLLWFCFVHADDRNIHRRAGTTVFPFLNLGYDSRAIAMGGASVAMPNEIYGMLSNPSAMAYIEKKQIMGGYEPVMLGIRGNALSYAMPAGNIGVIGTNMLLVLYGTVQEVDENKKPTGNTWEPYSFAGQVGWSRLFRDDFSIGVIAKGIYDRIGSTSGEYYAADGYAFDIGVQYRLLNSRLILGSVIQNLGFLREGYSERTDDFSLPFAAIVGISYNLKNIPPLRLALDASQAYDDFLNFHFGGELDIYKEYFSIRGGFNASSRDIEEKAGELVGSVDEEYMKTNWLTISLGIGVNAPISLFDVAIDAAFQARNNGLTPGFSLSGILSF
ncbi:MAG: PorV/PorQ family protein [Chitinivibrionales bacterium]|nr:PorV/PorQ family protein [Chitinivibrionales bacterium]